MVSGCWRKRGIRDGSLMIEHRDGVEFRVSGRTLTGRALVYGDVAPDYRERFVPGAFGEVRSIPINLQHDSAIIVSPDALLTDSPRSLDVRADLAEGSAALTLVRRGALSGFSIEFRAKDERREAGIRVIERAELSGLALVDQGAYPGSTVEVRARRSGLSGVFNYGRDRTVKDRGKRRKSRINRGAFSWQMREFEKLQGELSDAIGESVKAGIRDKMREVQLLAGPDYSKPLASLKAGTLKLRDGPDGLEFDAVKLPDASYAKDLQAGMAAKSADYGVDVLYKIPPRDVVPDAFEIIPEPGTGVEIEVIKQATLQAIAIVSRAPRGNPGAVKRRARVWL